MWLPTPIYEKTPQLWLLMAVLFVVLGIYIGFAYPLTYFYVLLGVVCGVRGLQVWRMRTSFRREQAEKGEVNNETLAGPLPN
jgi:hypothetical protein